MRCGKRIVKDGKYSWKWSGYNFGFPLHVIFTSHYIIFKQNTFSQPCDSSISLQPLRNIAFRLTLVYFDSGGKLSFIKTTDYKILTFEKDEEQVVMKLDSAVLSFPLYIFCNFLFLSLENPGNWQSCQLVYINILKTSDVSFHFMVLLLNTIMTNNRNENNLSNITIINDYYLSSFYLCISMKKKFNSKKIYLWNQIVNDADIFYFSFTINRQAPNVKKRL